MDADYRLMTNVIDDIISGEPSDLQTLTNSVIARETSFESSVRDFYSFGDDFDVAKAGIIPPAADIVTRCFPESNVLLEYGAVREANKAYSPQRIAKGVSLYGPGVVLGTLAFVAFGGDPEIGDAMFQTGFTLTTYGLLGMVATPWKSQTLKNYNLLLERASDLDSFVSKSYVGKVEAFDRLPNGEPVL